MSSSLILSATLLYLAPAVVLAAMRWHRAHPLWAVALGVPIALATDLICVLLLTRFVRLDVAVLLSRAAWLLAGAVAVVHRRGRLRWPSALGIRELVAGGIAVVLAVMLSRTISNGCHFADRAWHIPLVTSLRGQTIPFHNVYQPDVRLEYHFGGDVVAAMIQSTSFGRMHASLALSVEHALFFGLSAMTGALLLRAFGLRSLVWTLVGAMAPLLSGPLALPSLGARRDFRGYNFVSFFHVSFRPHCVLASLFILGFVGAALVALRARLRPTGWKTGAVLIACTAALAITDEASTGLLGLTLGVAWLIAPRVAHPRRLQGALLFAALSASFLLPQLVFEATLAPGSAPQHAVWVPWQSPGYYTPALPLAKSAWVLVRDFLPLLLLTFGAVVSLLGARRREDLAPVVQLVMLLAITVVVMCAVEVRSEGLRPDGGFSSQNHRFVTAILVSGPLFLGSMLLTARLRRSPWWHWTPALALGLVSLAMSAVSTYGWIGTGGKKSCFKSNRYHARDDLFAVDCARTTGAHFGAAPERPTYAAASVLYLWAGCNPSSLSGAGHVNAYRLKIGIAAAGKDALRDVSESVPSDSPILTACPSSPQYPSDAVCDLARRSGTCRPSGSKISLCWLSPGDRAELLSAGAPVHSAEPDDEPPEAP